MSNLYDTIIVGSGPAGISAAIYLKRYNLNPLVISSNKSALSKTLIENYYGIESITGEELYQRGIDQAKKLGIEIVETEVIGIDPYDNMKVETTSGDYNAKTVILATSKARNKLIVKGAKDLVGNGISMCATCDGFFYRGKKLGILGAGSFMEKELEVLERFTKDITIFTNGESYTNDKYPVVTDKVVEVTGEGKLEALKTANDSYNLDGLFVALGSANALDFANHIGLEIDAQNNVVVDKNFMTNVKGLFAAGDVIGGLLQVAKAVSDGAQAALAIKNFLKENK